MPAPISMDLRRRIVRAVERDSSIGEAARCRWWACPRLAPGGDLRWSPRIAARWTRTQEMRVCRAIARPVHWLASPGGSAPVRVTVRRTTGSLKGPLAGLADGIAQQSFDPAASANPRCQRQTAGGSKRRVFRSIVELQAAIKSLPRRAQPRPQPFADQHV
jgi:hypothetical protein